MKKTIMMNDANFGQQPWDLRRKESRVRMEGWEECSLVRRTVKREIREEIGDSVRRRNLMRTRRVRNQREDPIITIHATPTSMILSVLPPRQPLLVALILSLHCLLLT